MKAFTAVLFALVVAISWGQAPANKALNAAAKEFSSAKTAYHKHPKSASAKKRFVEAGVKYGHMSMTAPDLSPKVKYRQALRIYREVLKVDPKNPVAKPESDLIISIYKSMGRPVPKD